MIVADFRGYGSLGEILGVHSVASGVAAADAGHGQLAGFAADLGGLDAVRRRKSRVRQPFMNPGHDLSPDVLVEGGAAVLGT